MIKFNCKSCSRSIAINEQWAGKKTHCPYCDDLIRVPDCIVAIPVHHAHSLAIFAYVCSLIGFLACLPLAILGLILGYIVLKDDSRNRHAQNAVFFGWIALFIGFFFACVVWPSILVYYGPP